MLETKNNLDSPRIFRTKTLPIRESERFFQTEVHLYNFEILGSQLSRSTLSVPKNTPKILIFLTHERPSGWSGLSFHAPSHKASVFYIFNLAPDPHSNCEMTSKSAKRDFSFLTNAVVSSAYWQTLNCRPPAPGRRKPSMSLVALILHARTSTQRT